jgi:hypothetical protein
VRADRRVLRAWARDSGIALDNRDIVDKVAKDTGGAHTGQAATDHDRTGGSQRVPLQIKSSSLAGISILKNPI